MIDPEKVLIKNCLYLQISTILNLLVKNASDVEINLISVERNMEYSNLENEVRYHIS